MTGTGHSGKFEAAMFDIYRRAKAETGYNATLFLRMLTERGGIATAKTLINAEKQSDGYSALAERGRLDLTVEALVVEDARWRAQFTPEEIEKARRRLALSGYVPKDRVP
jgi:hypothetical protein